MSFNYILDTFKKIFKTSSKYEQIEKEAIGLIQLYYRGTIAHKKFYTKMMELQVRLQAANPDNVIDQGYPLWLSQFLGYAFYDWCNWYKLMLLHAEHPEKFNTPELEEDFQQLKAQNLDKVFREHCRNYLRELNALV